MKTTIFITDSKIFKKVWQLANLFTRPGRGMEQNIVSLAKSQTLSCNRCKYFLVNSGLIQILC